MIDVSKPGAPLLPQIDHFQIVAIKVAKEAVDDGVARFKHDDILQKFRVHKHLILLRKLYNIENPEYAVPLQEAIRSLCRSQK